MKLFKKTHIFEEENLIKMKYVEEIEHTKFDVDTIRGIFEGHKIIVLAKLVSYGLIKNCRQCICGNQMILRRKKSSGDGYNWLCKTSEHKREFSVREDSLFEDIRKPFDKVLLFFWCWSRDLQQSDIADMLRIDKNTICE
ncbi:hypothetical protein DMUE_3878 [Dictyocoela muelleri]|nr:hypothetical protein DMUE_3878 [Dictyocoela muelleri]